ETVLLGLARGSGARSIQGMAPWSPPWGRPLLGVRRADTGRLCADLGLSPHQDPHNASPEFTRVRVRTEVLPLLEEVLGGGVAAALARTGAQPREDAAVLDALAGELLARARDDAGGLAVQPLATAPAALRRRAIRAWLLAGGANAFTGKHLHAVAALTTDWRRQRRNTGGEVGRRTRTWQADTAQARPIARAVNVPRTQGRETITRVRGRHRIGADHRGTDRREDRRAGRADRQALPAGLHR